MPWASKEYRLALVASSTSDKSGYNRLRECRPRTGNVIVIRIGQRCPAERETLLTRFCKMENHRDGISDQLTHQFRGEIHRAIEADGLALVDQHTQCGATLPKHRHGHAWFTFLFAGSYIERLPS